MLIQQLIDHAALNHGDTEIVSRTVEGAIHRYTYRDAHKRSKKIAEALHDAGHQARRMGTVCHTKVAKWWLPDDVQSRRGDPAHRDRQDLETRLREDFKDYVCRRRSGGVRLGARLSRAALPSACHPMSGPGKPRPSRLDRLAGWPYRCITPQHGRRGNKE